MCSILFSLFCMPGGHLKGSEFSFDSVGCVVTDIRDWALCLCFYDVGGIRHAKNEFKPLLYHKLSLSRWQAVPTPCERIILVMGQAWVYRQYQFLQSWKPWKRTNIADRWSSVSFLCERWKLLLQVTIVSRLWKESCEWCAGLAQFAERCSLRVHIKGSEKFFYFY